MNRTVTMISLVSLLLMLASGPAFASMIACPPSPPPGSTLECGVSNSEPEETLTWEASFEDDTVESGEVVIDEEGSGGLAVDIPDDPELAGTQFTIELEDGASYAGMVGAPEEGAEAAAEDAEDEAPADEEADEDAEVESEQVEQRPDEDSEVGLGAGGSAGAPTLALLVGGLAIVLVLGGGAHLVRVGARR